MRKGKHDIFTGKSSQCFHFTWRRISYLKKNKQLRILRVILYCIKHYFTRKLTANIWLLKFRKLCLMQIFLVLTLYKKYESEVSQYSNWKKLTKYIYVYGPIQVQYFIPFLHEYYRGQTITECCDYVWFPRVGLFII